jgi:hypothetical protein
MVSEKESEEKKLLDLGEDQTLPPFFRDHPYFKDLYFKESIKITEAMKKLSKKKCTHKKRVYDLAISYEFTKNYAKLIVPNWCQECSEKEKDDFRETNFYYKYKSFHSIPDTDYNFNSLNLEGFEIIEYTKIDIDYFDMKGDLEVTFKASHQNIGYEEIKLIILYDLCSEKEYEGLKNERLNELEVI